MHNALTVDQHVNLLQRQIVKPHGFNDFQSLIHQGSAIDGDFCTHLPVWMLQSIRLGHMFQLLTAHTKEGAAGAGQNHTAHFPAVSDTHQTLKNGRVLGVHGNDLNATALGLAHNKLTGADQSLFIGKSNALSCPNSGKCRL